MPEDKNPMLHSEGDRLTRVIVCTPKKEYFQVDDLEVHNITEVADKEKTRAQHDQLKSIMRKRGAEVRSRMKTTGKGQRTIPTRP